MADVQVKTVELELRTVKLNKSILKQMPVLGLDKDEDPDKVIGWVHGSVLGDDYKQWLIFKTGVGTYGRYDAMASTCAKYEQIYIV